ncbi:MAG: pirin family protein [Pseudomonadota bacterium]
MLELRSADDRGFADFGWLKSRHSFSFGSYYDPEHMGFGPLRVINEDRVEAGRGFEPHGHTDMEILSYVLTGALEHNDSMGNGSVIRPGDVQRMSAGTGVTHSEMNHSDTDGVHFLQIWILPERQGSEPGYEQRHYAADRKRNQLRLVGSRDGREGSVTIHQDVDLYATLLAKGEQVSHELAPGRLAWLQVVSGSLTLRGQRLEAGDGVGVTASGMLDIQALAESEALLFDMTGGQLQ